MESVIKFGLTVRYLVEAYRLIQVDERVISLELLI